MKDYFAVVQAIRNGTVLYRIQRRDPLDPGSDSVTFCEIATLNRIIRDMARYRSDSGVLPEDTLGSLWYPDGIDPSTFFSDIE
ncbi:hypothetical protein [Spirochaeta africana]|uniref:Uncharacterized protein n=1 Tax=Spirochaeta africana (strain ATCC 700263 / DSM 8902 / Z-7692) TaxID=889378 RepID=H9UH23_SPIAZ|nr:hypothetical protein [Spirochaeta africana]AFG36816.1 hypothetical protein Spiaf_0717 [Spirochaeta africana DSM 8902]